MPDQNSSAIKPNLRERFETLIAELEALEKTVRPAFASRDRAGALIAERELLKIQISQEDSAHAVLKPSEAAVRMQRRLRELNQEVETLWGPFNQLDGAFRSFAARLRSAVKALPRSSNFDRIRRDLARLDLLKRGMSGSTENVLDDLGEVRLFLEHAHTQTSGLNRFTLSDPLIFKRRDDLNRIGERWKRDKWHKRLHAARQAKRKLQKEIASDLQVSVETYRKWEAGRAPNRNNLMKILTIIESAEKTA